MYLVSHVCNVRREMIVHTVVNIIIIIICKFHIHLNTVCKKVLSFQWRFAKLRGFYKN